MTDPFACRLPSTNSLDRIKLGHGSGGKLTAQLISQVFLPALGSAFSGQLEDAAILDVHNDVAVAITTDSYVVKPYRFPGGNIASLAVHGTINDLAVRGAKPLFLTASFIIEEGFPLSELQELAEDMRHACEESGVILAAADTKVVQKSACDQIFITTTGIGRVRTPSPPAAGRTEVGDAVLVSGQLGMHGMAVMCAREDLQLEHSILSDSASLHELCEETLSQHDIHSMRDITRGGLISVLCEIAEASGVGFEIEEALIPMHPQVASACELLGLDPLHVACEGRLVATVAPGQADSAVATMRKSPVGASAATIGKAIAEHPGKVILKSRIGGRRFVDRLSGDQLPRIC
jgi:hydrogenase expression/formation protein HypE